jgi:hypothetical protein
MIFMMGSYSNEDAANLPRSARVDMDVLDTIRRGEGANVDAS